MPYTKPLPEWKNAGTKPPQSKIDSGWAIGDKPPAGWWNWWMYNTYYALQELQINAVHTEKLGTASGVATLGADSKLTASQLPAIGSSQITDNSITNTDLATDVKVGSLSTLTTTAKTSVTAAVNEVKSSADAKIPNSEKGAANGVATLGIDSKLTASQLPAIGSAQITDGSITNTDLATDVKVGSLTTLKTSNKASVTVAVNEVHDDFDAHNTDAVKHITATERAKWDGAQLFPLTATDGGPKGTVTDVNAALTVGVFLVPSSTLNAPSTAVGLLFVQRRTSSHFFQEYWEVSGNSRHYRTSSNGGSTWSIWSQVETTEGAQAKIDLVQKFKLTQDTGIAKTLPANSNDLNAVTETGIYMVDGSALNQPTGFTFGVLIHIARISTNYTQIFQQNGSGIIFTRAWISGKWSSWRRAVDDMSFVNTLLGNKFNSQSLANFVGKVSGSTTANPHSVKATGSTPYTSLQTPSAPIPEINGGGLAYGQLSTLDGTSYTTSINSNGAISQQLFSFDLIAHVERTYGTIPGAMTVDKVVWLKSNLSRMAFNWWGNGASPIGNKATVSVFLVDTGNYAGANITHTNSGVSKLVYGFTQIINKIDGNGFVHFIAYAEPSNGTTASVINTDYAELEVELSTEIWNNVPALTELTLTLQNGATDGGRTPKMKYWGHNVQCAGTVSNAVVDTVFATLPAVYRPAQSQIFAIGGFGTASAGKIATVLIGQDGTMRPLSIESGTSRIDLSTINFLV